MTADKQIVFFDGLCNLCNGFVQFIIKRDPEARFTFASLQSEVGNTAMNASGLKATNLRTVVYQKNARYFLKSDAALHILKDIGRGWQWLYPLIIIPRFLRNLIYDLVAGNRYRLFGKRTECMVPTPELKDRFLE